MNVLRNKDVKLPASVESNIINIINSIQKIYEIKFAELQLKTTKIDNNTEEVRNQIFEIQNFLRNEMENCSELISVLFENEEYTGKQFLKNFIEEFNLVEAKPKKRYAFYDAERLIRDEYEFCKNRKVRKAINKMESQRRKFYKLSNNYTKKTQVKKILSNS